MKFKFYRKKSITRLPEMIITCASCNSCPRLIISSCNDRNCSSYSLCFFSAFSLAAISSCNFSLKIATKVDIVKKFNKRMTVIFLYCRTSVVVWPFSLREPEPSFVARQWCRVCVFACIIRGCPYIRLKYVC